MAHRRFKTAKTSAAPTAVVALGGHAFMRRGETGSHVEHIHNARTICDQLMTLVQRDYRLVITHGNGPQVGALLDRNELSRDQVPAMPLDVLVAQTEGSLGYFLQQELLNSLKRSGLRRFVVTVVTQVVVDPKDPAFQEPTKPVGPFLSEEEAKRRERDLGWNVGEDAGRGWRRLVPSPIPTKVIQRTMIREAAHQGHIVVAGGGGGIPVLRNDNGEYVPAGERGPAHHPDGGGSRLPAVQPAGPDTAGRGDALRVRAVHQGRALPPRLHGAQDRRHPRLPRPRWPPRPDHDARKAGSGAGRGCRHTLRGQDLTGA
ncbi:MAG: amino acid kinase family protein [Planctomycetota bacterium]